MNFAQIMGLVRLFLGAGGSSLIATALHTTPDAVNGVAAAASPGSLVVGALALAGSAGWSIYAHTVANTVDRAVRLAGNEAAKGNPAPAAKAVSSLKTHLSPNG